MIPEELEKQIRQARQEVRMRVWVVGVGGAREAENPERMPPTNPVVGVCERRARVPVNIGKLGAVLHKSYFLVHGSLVTREFTFLGGRSL